MQRINPEIIHKLDYWLTKINDLPSFENLKYRIIREFEEAKTTGYISDDILTELEKSKDIFRNKYKTM